MKSDMPQYCQPRDYKGERHWMIVFEDADVKPEVYTDEAAAIAAYEKAQWQWNCSLFATVPRADLSRPAMPNEVVECPRCGGTDKDPCKPDCHKNGQADFERGWDMAMTFVESEGLIKEDAVIPRYTAKQAVRKASQSPQPEAVTVEELGDHINRWRFVDDKGWKFGDYLAENFPNGLKIIKKD